MTAHNPGQTWNEYHEQLKARRRMEAATMWSRMQAAGIGEDTLVLLDFTHESTALRHAAGLARRLSDTYLMDLRPIGSDGRWQVTGTSRPEGILISGEQLEAWVGIMADLGRLHRCVFKAWTLEAPATSQTFVSAEPKPGPTVERAIGVLSPGG